MSAKSLTLTISPADGTGWFHGHVGQYRIVTSQTPFLDAARELIAQGYPPDTVMAMHHAGSTTISLRAAIGAAAKLTVSEEADRAARFKRWKPRNVGEGSPQMAKKRSGHAEIPGRIGTPL